MSPARASGYKSLLGIELDSGRIRVAVAHRDGNGGRIGKTLDAPFRFDLASAEPALAGGAIRNLLNEAGVHETRCLLCPPSNWIFYHPMELPDMSKEDRRGFIELQTERAFPIPPKDLSLSLAEISVNGGTFAMAAAVPLAAIRAAEAACKAAGLTPVSVAAPSAAPGDVEGEAPVLVLRKREEGLDVRVECGGAPLAARWFGLDDPFGEETPDGLDPMLLREIRVTVNSLPEPARARLGLARFAGPEGWHRRMESLYGEPFRAMGVEIAPPRGGKEGGTPEPLEAALLDALAGRKPVFEFLPPRVGRARQILARISSRGNLVTGGAAAAAALAGLAAFAWQSVTLSNLESRWDGIRDRVAEVEQLQNNVKFYRPWFDDGMPNLAAWLELTEAFPEEGTVWAKSVELERASVMACSGFASDIGSLREMLERLNSNERVAQLQIQQMQGENPLQFVLRMEWTGG